METILSNMTIVQYFLLLLGQPIINIVIKVINANLKQYKQIDHGEFLHFLGIWLLISKIGSGFNKMEYWSNTLLSTENRAPRRFNK